MKSKVGGAAFAGEEGEENVGTISFTSQSNSLFQIEWQNNPFDVPLGTDKQFSHLQTVITLPNNNNNNNDDDNVAGIKEKTYSTLKLQEFGALNSGKVTLPGPWKIRVRWSPEMMAAGALYALLKIQNVVNPRPEPPISQVKKLLYHLDDPAFVLKGAVRISAEYQWMLQRAKALSHAFWLYRRDPKYHPAVGLEQFAEHRELVTSLKRFLGEGEAREQASEIISVFKRHRYPMHPVNMLQVMKRLVTKALRGSGDQLDVVRYECRLEPSSAVGADLTQQQISLALNCLKEEIEDPP